MTAFKNALVRKPCRNMVHGLSTAALGRPDYEKALVQHDAYVRSPALLRAGGHGAGCR